MRFILAIEVERVDGPPVGLDLVRQALADEILDLGFGAARGAQREYSKYKVLGVTWAGRTDS